MAHERLATVLVNTPGGPVRMNKADVEKANEEKAGSFDIVADSELDPDSPISVPVPSPGRPAPAMPEGVQPPVATNVVDPANPGVARQEGQPYEYADPADAKFTAQIGSRWYVVNQKGQRFLKGQSAAGYADQDAANAAALKMTADHAANEQQSGNAGGGQT